MKKSFLMLSAIVAFSGTSLFAQTAQTTPANQTGAATKSQTAPKALTAPAAPLQLNPVAAPAKIEFPPVDPKNFNAKSPTTAQVNAFLKELWGYDPNRIWQVSGIQTTQAPNVSKVTIMVGEQGVSHAPAGTIFFVTPDGGHAIAGNEVVAFGAHPFASNRMKLEQQANGPSRGAASKDLMIVEFADLQCPHCKDAAATIDNIQKDFPNAHFVFENFPLTVVHPAAQKSAEYGVCVAKIKGNAAFFQYVQAVFDNQAGLTSNVDATLKQAATKAGADPAEVDICAGTASAKAAVAASVKLGEDIGVDQTPLLYINGRPMPIAGIPYATLKQVITYIGTEGGSDANAGGK